MTAVGPLLLLLATAPTDTCAQCAHCHAAAGERGGAPPLDQVRRPQGAWELAGRLWNHVPAMFAAVPQQALGWPQFTVADMEDLTTYLGADAARDPAPDLLRGARPRWWVPAA